MQIIKRKAFSLVELIIVIIIIGVLGSVGASFGSRQVSNARMSTVASNLQIIASDIESAVFDVGFIDNLSDAATVKRYFSSWDAKYLTSPLDLDSISSPTAYGSDFTGVHFNTNGYEDPWGNEYRLYYLVPAEGEAYRIIMASAGPNGRFSDDADNAYINDGFEDDVIIVMEPRG